MNNCRFQRRCISTYKQRENDDFGHECSALQNIGQDGSACLALSIMDPMAGRWILLAILTPYVGWLVFAYEYHLLDGVNLAIHEVGHLLFSFFGKTLYFLGGTLAQLMFPAAFVGQFLYQGKKFDACVMGIWFCESLMYGATYIADARIQALPLVGGHIHDWNWLLSRWGWLESCESIGSFLHATASLGAISLLLAAASLLVQERRVHVCE